MSDMGISQQLLERVRRVATKKGVNKMASAAD